MRLRILVLPTQPILSNQSSIKQAHAHMHTCMHGFWFCRSILRVEVYTSRQDARCFGLYVCLASELAYVCKAPSQTPFLSFPFSLTHLVFVFLCLFVCFVSFRFVSFRFVSVCVVCCCPALQTHRLRTSATKSGWLRSPRVTRISTALHRATGSRSSSEY